MGVGEHPSHKDVVDAVGTAAATGTAAMPTKAAAPTTDTAPDVAAVDSVRSVLSRNPLKREILYRVLQFCTEMRKLSAVEDFIASLPEFKQSTVSQYALINYLVKAQGLTELELDAQDEVVTNEHKEGLTENEVDDLVVTLAYLTTQAGTQVAEEMAPQARFQRLLEIQPTYYDTYIEVLDFLFEKHPFSEVDDLLRGRDLLTANRDVGERPLQPSVFVDKLEGAGCVLYDNGWQITQEGRELLAAIREQTPG